MAKRTLNSKGKAVVALGVIILLTVIVLTALGILKLVDKSHEKNKPSIPTEISEVIDDVTEKENDTTEDITEGTTETVVYYATTTLNVRKEPSTEGEKLGLLQTGDKVEAIEEKDGWVKFDYNGETGYVYAQYLSKTRPEGETNPAEIDRNLVNPAEGNWNLVIVNARNAFTEDYEPEIEEVCPGLGYGMYMDKRAASHYTEMYNAAKADGITLTPISGYRSYELQNRNWRARIENEQAAGYSYDEAVARASAVILPPGTSEHNLGVAMDIISLYTVFKDTAEYRWLCANGPKYGFILRYPEGKEEITGVEFEPWHWRYVGTEYSQKINDSGLCLEEYVEKYGTD